MMTKLNDLFKTSLEKLAVVTSLQKHTEKSTVDSEERKQINELISKFFSKDENVEVSNEEYVSMTKIYHDWLENK